METIVIIGAGASGLACMNELVKTNKYNIIVLEQSNKAARKILASGNGRCNVSNLNMDIKYYNHQDPLIEKLIKEFSGEIGVITENNVAKVALLYTLHMQS